MFCLLLFQKCSYGCRSLVFQIIILYRQHTAGITNFFFSFVYLYIYICIMYTFRMRDIKSCAYTRVVHANLYCDCAYKFSSLNTEKCCHTTLKKEKEKGSISMWNPENLFSESRVDSLGCSKLKLIRDA